MIQRIALILTIDLALLGSSAFGAWLPYRWVMVQRNLDIDQDVDDVKKIVETAAAHGLNGMLLSARLDWLDVRKPDFFERLERVKRVCAEHNVEIIPDIFSVGTGGGSIFVHDRDLAEGIPVNDALFVVQGREARPQADPPVEIVNGGLEKYEGQRVVGAKLQDRPGEVSFVDTQVFKEGKASLRFENFGRDPHGMGRLMFEVPVHPYRSYRVKLAARAEHLVPSRSFRFIVSGDKADLAMGSIAATDQWTDFTFVFNSLQHEKVLIYLGVWNAKAGKVWLDDVRIEEPGIFKIVRRSGCPLVVRDAKSARVYEEGRDFAPVSDPASGLSHDAPPIRLLPGGRIAEGQSLRVSFYQAINLGDRTPCACMSEPKVYELWQNQVRLIQQHLAPKSYFLHMDEIREGGTCETCKKRHTTMAQILGDCITRQFKLIRAVNPTAKIFVWSDMLDPNHNAHANYYLVDGDLTGSWKYIPKELVIACWYYEKRAESLQHFSQLGFKTMAAAYYDTDNLENPMGWLAAMKKTPRAIGIMYTTWENKYELLGPFGDLVAKGRAPSARMNSPGERP